MKWDDPFRPIRLDHKNTFLPNVLASILAYPWWVHDFCGSVRHLLHDCPLHYPFQATSSLWIISSSDQRVNEDPLTVLVSKDETVETALPKTNQCLCACNVFSRWERLRKERKRCMGINTDGFWEVLSPRFHLLVPVYGPGGTGLGGTCTQFDYLAVSGAA